MRSAAKNVTLEDHIERIMVEDDDAYNAPTKVGPMAKAAVAHLFAEADKKHASEPPSETPRTILTTSGIEVRHASGEREISIPRVYDEDEELDADALLGDYHRQSGQTKLLPLAVAPVVTVPKAAVPPVAWLDIVSPAAPEREPSNVLKALVVTLVVALASFSVCGVALYLFR